MTKLEKINHTYVGKKSGRLTIQSIINSGRKSPNNYLAVCKCDCGKEATVHLSNIRSGHTRSCSCIRNETWTLYSKYKKEYQSWDSAKGRCNNPKNISYKNYGARGIKMCDEWANSFDSFFNYIGARPTPKHSLDRINNNGNYEPGNVRWATTKEQGVNRRETILLTYKGETLCAEDMAKKYGLSSNCLKERIRKGWSIEKAITEPTKRTNVNKKQKEVNFGGS